MSETLKNNNFVSCFICLSLTSTKKYKLHSISNILQCNFRLKAFYINEC
jgi:hypothetical protein